MRETKLTSSLNLLEKYHPKGIENYHEHQVLEQISPKKYLVIYITTGVIIFSGQRAFDVFRTKIALQYQKNTLKTGFFLHNHSDYLSDIDKVFKPCFDQMRLEDRLAKLLFKSAFSYYKSEQLYVSDMALIMDTINLINAARENNLIEDLNKLIADLNNKEYKRKIEFVNCNRYLYEGINHLESILVKKKEHHAKR